MELLAPTDLRPDLAATLRFLSRTLDVRDFTVDHRAVANRASQQGSPTSALASALPRTGLRASWVDASLCEAVQHARADLPLVTAVERGLTRGWMVLQSRRGNRVQVWSSSAWLPNGWFDVEELMGEMGGETLRWARVAPALPMSPLGAVGSSERPSPMRRLSRLLFAERTAMAVVVLYGVGVGILSLATPLAIQVLINWLAFGGLYQPVVVLASFLLLCLALAGSLQAAQRYTVELIQRRLFARTVTEVGARLARVRVDSLDRIDGPELANRFFDVLTLQKATKTLLLDGLTAVLQAAVGLLLLAVYHPYLLVFDLAVIALVTAALVPMLRQAQETALVESKTKYAVAAWIEEIARHPLVFKLGGSEHAQGRLERSSLGYLRARARHFRAFFVQYLAMRVVQVVVQVGLLLTCGWLVLDGQLTLGQLVAAEFIVAAALAGLTKFTDKLETVYDLLAGVDKLGALMDLPHERPVGGLPASEAEGADLELRQVSFHWDTGPVLTDADLVLPRGSRTAIVGQAGAGKSVLAEILSGLRDPTRGSVWRNGQPLKELLREEIYANTLVLRPGSVLHDTVRENLLLGRGGVEDVALWDALSTVGLSSCVADLENGLQTVLSPSGAPLSEYRVKALLLARALVEPPAVLVLDGLLDGLPSRVRSRLIASLDTLPDTTTVVLLTEDHTTANELRRIVELREGGLHERPRLSPV